jgi:hypothetical protein
MDNLSLGEPMGWGQSFFRGMHHCDTNLIYHRFTGLLTRGSGKGLRPRTGATLLKEIRYRRE